MQRAAAQVAAPRHLAVLGILHIMGGWGRGAGCTWRGMGCTWRYGHPTDHTRGWEGGKIGRTWRYWASREMLKGASSLAAPLPSTIGGPATMRTLGTAGSTTAAARSISVRSPRTVASRTTAASLVSTMSGARGGLAAASLGSHTMRCSQGERLSESGGGGGASWLGPAA